MSHVGSYWRGVTQRLQAEVEQMNQLIEHQGTKGTENELSLARMVQNLIPTRFGVGSGLLIDSRGESSKQMDVVVFERGNEPALFAQTNQVLFPVENVRLCIEIKTTLTKSAIEDAREKNASIQKLRPSVGAHPPMALFAYGADIQAGTIANHLDEEVTDKGPRPDMTTAIDLALLVGDISRAKAWKRGVAGLHQHVDGVAVPGSVQEPTESEKGTSVIRGNVGYPVVSVDSKWLIGEPSRALLLFAEWIVCTLQGPATRPVMSFYIDPTDRELTSV